MLNQVSKIQLLQLVTKYGIRINDFNNGYVNVTITNWPQYASYFEDVLQKLNEFNEIKSVHFQENTYTLAIHYDERLLGNEKAIHYFLSLINE